MIKEYVFQKQVHLTKLSSEISAFLSGLSGIIVDGPNIHVCFEPELSEDDEALLNHIVDVHDPSLSQIEKDKIKYTKRSQALSKMISEMAVENVARVRSGIWTVNQLVGLTQDAQIKEILSDLMSLSFEIAYSKVDGVTNPIVTSDIKAAWKAKLAANFYNE